MTRFKLALTAFILIPLIDFPWIALLMKPFYMEELGPHRRLIDGQFSPELLPAAIVYVLLALGVTFFVLSWVKDWKQALGTGGLFGLINYGVYDFTNLSTMNHYSWSLALADTAWGTVLLGLVSLITFFEREWFDS